VNRNNIFFVFTDGRNNSFGGVDANYIQEIIHIKDAGNLKKSDLFLSVLCGRVIDNNHISLLMTG